MLKLLRESQVAPEFRRLTKSATETVIAVPFWGKGAIKLLGLDRGQNMRVICNLASPACNPYEIEAIKKSKGVKIRTNPRLHAKIYATKEFSIVGSSNASTNGLAVEGSAARGWIEANVLSDDATLVPAALELFEEIWNSKETGPVKGPTLKIAKLAWDNRPKRQMAPTAKSLFAACRENPELFRSVFILAYSEPLDPGGKKKLREVQKKGEATAETEALDLKNAYGYQCYEKEFQPGCWLLDLNCMNPQKPRFGGTAHCHVPLVQYLVKGEPALTLAIGGSVKLEGRSWRISATEKAALVAHAKQIQRKERLVPLSEAIHIIDRRTTA